MLFSKLKSNVLFLKQPNIEKVINSFGAKTLDEAVELLSMMGGGGNNQQQPISTNQASTKGSRDIQQPNQKVSISETTNQNSGASSTTNQNAVTSTTTNERSYSLKPLLLLDGITEELIDLYANLDCESVADHLVVVIHALFTETGFVAKEVSPFYNQLSL